MQKDVFQLALSLHILSYWQCDNSNLK